MKRLLSHIYNSSPKDVIHQFKARFAPAATAHNEQIRDELSRLFSQYQVENLKSISPEEFQEDIQSRIGTVDYKGEGFSEDELQQRRKVSVEFHWGHNHDFGNFQLEGRMKERHISLIANFISLFPIDLDNFKDKDILDVGPWTGGTTLLLASLAKSVRAIEIVKKYADTISFMSRSFGIDDKVSVTSTSVYECNTEEFHNRFEVVHFPGVLYHISDPLIALRILFNALKVGGFVLVESSGINTTLSRCNFEGSLRNKDGGASWFVPSPAALHRMLREAGFEDVQTTWHNPTSRVYGYGKKKSQVGICKEGLSVSDIK